jgi:hypothetical protein
MTRVLALNSLVNLAKCIYCTALSLAQEAELVQVFYGREYICLDCSKLRTPDASALTKALTTACTAATHHDQLNAASEVWQLAVQCSSYAQAPLSQQLYASNARPAQPQQGYAELCARQCPAEYSKFAAGVNLLCTVTELTAVVRRDSAASAAAKSYAGACVAAAGASLQTMLARMMSSREAAVLVQYIATPAAPCDAVQWQQYLTKMQNTAAKLSAAAVTSNPTTTAVGSSTATASTASAGSSGAGTVVAAAAAVVPVSENNSALQEGRNDLLKQLEKKFSAKVQQDVALKQQLQDKLRANAAAIAAKKQKNAQIEQQEREQYAALLQQLEQEEVAEQQCVQQLAMQMVAQRLRLQLRQ